MRKDKFYISFNPDEPGGGGGSAQVTLSAEEHKALLDSSVKLEAAQQEKKKTEEELGSKIKLLEEEKESLQKEKETIKKEKETAESTLAGLELTVKNEYLERLSEDHRKIAALIPSIEGLAKYVKLNEVKLPAGADTTRPGSGNRDIPGAKWDDLSYDEKEDLRIKRPALWKKLYREKFGTKP